MVCGDCARLAAGTALFTKLWRRMRLGRKNSMGPLAACWCSLMLVDALCRGQFSRNSWSILYNSYISVLVIFWEHLCFYMLFTPKETVWRAEEFKDPQNFVHGSLLPSVNSKACSQPFLSYELHKLGSCNVGEAQNLQPAPDACWILLNPFQMLVESRLRTFWTVKVLEKFCYCCFRCNAKDCGAAFQEPFQTSCCVALL